MALNTFEQLISEWYEIQGYFLRRNVVGKKQRDGWEGELDVVAFHPVKQHIVHIEAAINASSLTALRSRLQKQFTAGQKYLSKLYEGIEPLPHMEQIFLSYRAWDNLELPEGVKILTIGELLMQIRDYLKPRGIRDYVVPQTFPLLRVLHYASHYWTSR